MPPLSPNPFPYNSATPALAERFCATRANTLTLAAPLSAEDQQVQSMPEASPTKWHLAHTTWFFETFVLRDFAGGYEPFDAAYHFLFNSYYEAEGPRCARAARGLLTRPSLDEVLCYRAHVDAAVAALLADAGRPAGIAARIELGLAHEEQHQELMLMDIKHLFSLNPLRPAYAPFAPHEARAAPPLGWTRFDGGVFAIGSDASGFAFDNERPRHKVHLEPFRLANRLATNGEFIAFIEDGGYERPELWLADGWAEKERQGWRAPLYWRKDAQGWATFTLRGERALNTVEPVSHVSYYEADAFARWKGKRLPREAEWEVAARETPPRGNFLDSGALHPRPAPDPASLGQMYGDVWEWTQSPYTPYPGFRASAGAIGEYNGKFMINQMVLRGGSCATPAGHVRATYRNFFPPAARWAFSGVRLADDV